MLVTRILRPMDSFKCPLQSDFELSALSSLIMGMEVTQNCTNGSICIYLFHPPVLMRPPKGHPKSLLQAPGTGVTGWVRARPGLGFWGCPKSPCSTTHLSLHVPAMAQLKLENTKQPFLASCNFVLALYCSKNSFYFILKPCFPLQNNQYTQNLSA